MKSFDSTTGESTWITPPELQKALGEFDLDPCAADDMPYRTATRMVTKSEDGLKVDWTGERECGSTLRTDGSSFRSSSACTRESPCCQREPTASGSTSWWRRGPMRCSSSKDASGSSTRTEGRRDRPRSRPCSCHTRRKTRRRSASPDCRGCCSDERPSE